jgi:hypothetical protein
MNRRALLKEAAALVPLSAAAYLRPRPEIDAKIRRLISVHGDPWRVTRTPDDHEIWLSHTSQNTVTVVHATERRVTPRIALPHRSFSIGCSPDGLMMYAGGNGAITSIEAKTKRVLKTIPITGEVFGLQFSRDGRTI